MVGASVVVVAPLSVVPPAPSPLATVAAPAAARTVGDDAALMAASFPYFLSQIFVSEPPEDYVATALSGFQASIGAVTGYVQAAPGYFTTLGDYVRENPSSLPSAASRVVYDLVNVIDRTSLLHEISGPIIHRVIYPLLTEQAREVFDSVLMTGDNITLRLLKLTLPEPLGADGNIPGLPKLVTTPWQHPFSQQSYPPMAQSNPQGRAGQHLIAVSGGDTERVVVHEDRAADPKANLDEIRDQPSGNPAVSIVRNATTSTRGIGQSPTASQRSLFPGLAGAGGATARWNPGAEVKKVLDKTQSAISSTLSKINNGMRKAASVGNTTTPPSAGDADTP